MKNPIKMSKAEEKALEKYPAHSVLIVPARGGGYYADSHLREGFIEGYHQAEKELELTWEDMRELHIIFAQIDVDIELCKTDIKAETLGYYKEVLKRFKES